MQRGDRTPTIRLHPTLQEVERGHSRNEARLQLSAQLGIPGISEVGGEANHGGVAHVRVTTDVGNRQERNCVGDSRKALRRLLARAQSVEDPLHFQRQRMVARQPRPLQRSLRGVWS